jgi:ATP-dependent DNA helicase RecQ
MPDLTSLLHRTFGHASFRANQEAVCRAATDGRDVLLVMPTGAGKSLCYQLPAIARGGTALVVSPLIALMDDQAAKLSAHGLKVGRIHSGLSRDETRQACRDYLDGTLNFLFIAPERLRVPGFPEMLARRKPALIAIDEAHCISAWGHDFRPDYRTLGEHLPALRPAPIIALTATATPTVQQDIVAQLQLQNPALFIHGFRRNNLAIEVVEMSKPRRHEFTTQLLSNAANRPAIVYAPSRKSAEELAAELHRHFPAAAYHAGLEPSVRERVQQAFQSGKLEVVVATIAFGMGIDKADVRTVVHTALPASVEAFYQEIGRAGRDGLPSRTVLLHSYADRKMHEFFLDRDYPPATDLARVAQVLTSHPDPAEYLMPEPIAKHLKMDLDTFSKAIEKLIAQGAATIDLAGNVRATPRAKKPESWRAGYDAQIAFRRSQIDRMSAFAETQQCRMTAVIRHFGDTADAHKPCGQCDFCSPNSSTAQTFAEPTTSQARDLRSILRALESRSTSTGKLHTDLALGLDRKQFDVLLDALARAGLITLTTDTFTSKDDGRIIAYKKAALTHEGRSDDANELAGVVLPAASESESAPTRSRTPKSGSRTSATNAHTVRRSTEEVPANLTADQKTLETNLRAWRKSEAAKTGKPAFIVLSDAVIRSVAIAHPQSIPELLTVPGIGPNKADHFGANIIAICRATDTDEPRLFSAVTKPSVSPPMDRSPNSNLLRTKIAASAAERPTARPIPAQAAGLGSGAKELSSAESATHPHAVATFHRTRPEASDPTAALTPEQQLLDAQLRAWRKTESERIRLPQFFVLGASALRSIVMIRPKTLAQLKTIAGVGPDKTDRFGASILEICRMESATPEGNHAS